VLVDQTEHCITEYASDDECLASLDDTIFDAKLSGVSRPRSALLVASSFASMVSDTREYS